MIVRIDVTDTAHITVDRIVDNVIKLTVFNCGDVSDILMSDLDAKVLIYMLQETLDDTTS